MQETQTDKIAQQEMNERKQKGKEQNVYLAKIGLMIFITFACCILFFFMLLRYQGFADGWHKIVGAAQSIIIGLVLAYLLNPIMEFLERKLYKRLKGKMKTDQKAKKLSRGLGIAGAILFLLIIIILLIAAIVPSVISCIVGVIDTLPGNVQNFIKVVQSGKLGEYEVTGTISDMLTKLVDYVENWATKTLLPEAKTYLLQITSGMINIVKAVINFIVGIIVAAYVLMIKESLIGQSKKAIYAIFKPRQGNIIIETMHKADEIFGGFIIGKVIDSAIIGVICYVGCSILHIPDAMLVAVIVGVTNIRSVYRSGPIVAFGCCPESVARTVFVDFYYYFTTGGRQYHRTEDPWKFNRIIILLGYVCHPDRWRTVRIPRNASRSSGICDDLLYCSEARKSFHWKPSASDRYRRVCRCQECGSHQWNTRTL